MTPIALNTLHNLQNMVTLMHARPEWRKRHRGLDVGHKLLSIHTRTDTGTTGGEGVANRWRRDIILISKLQWYWPVSRGAQANMFRIQLDYTMHDTSSLAVSNSNYFHIYSSSHFVIHRVKQTHTLSNQFSPRIYRPLIRSFLLNTAFS